MKETGGRWGRIDLPRCSKIVDAMNDKTLNDTTSPIDAANGVAKLSGFMWNRCDSNITATKTKSMHATATKKKKENHDK